MPYGSEIGVERLIGDIVTSRDFTISSTPSSTQISAVLDDVTADLDRELQAQGYRVPVLLADDTTAYNYLAAVNNYGAAAIVLGMIPAHAFRPGLEGLGETRAQMFEARFQNAMKVIQEKRIRATRSVGRFSQVFAGSQEDTDANRKLPFFRRGMHDVPGQRSLTGPR